MATNPYFTQYHTQRFSFIGSPQQRDGTAAKDQRFVNMYPEMITSPITEGKKYYLKKRPGVTTKYQFTAGEGRGIFYWEVNQAYYTVIGSSVYLNGGFLFSLNTSTGPVGFCEFRSDSAIELVLCDGTQGWIINGAGSAGLITDPNFPSPHIPMPVFLDGYIFVAAANTQQIHNSQLQNPAIWPSDGFIDAEMFPDVLVGLSKVQNYLACIGQNSIEWLYDNANATGSPLQRNAPAVSQLGCPAPKTINQTEKELILVGQTAAGGRTVWVIDGFQPTEIGNAPVREALDLEDVSISVASAFTIQCAGHKWYVLNLVSGGRTFVYDFEEKMWHEWTSGLNNTVFQYEFGADSGNGAPVLLSYTAGTVVELTPTVYTDLGSVINCVVTTSKIDFDTIKRKRLYRLSIIADAPNGPNNVPITVSWSDDDYNTYTSGTTLQINGSYPTITQLGYTRRRAFKFVYQQPYPLRMESFEVDLIQEVRR